MLFNFNFYYFLLLGFLEWKNFAVLNELWFTLDSVWGYNFSTNFSFKQRYQKNSLNKLCDGALSYRQIKTKHPLWTVCDFLFPRVGWWNRVSVPGALFVNVLTNSAHFSKETSLIRCSFWSTDTLTIIYLDKLHPPI